MKEKVVKIKEVHSGSIAEEVGIEPGDQILSVNKSKIKDVFDYRFLTTEEYLEVEVLKASGEVWEIEIEKEEYEDLGIEFDDPMLDDAKSCTNNCIFCFIDQLPKGMRDTLYFKDDDTRLSFMMGNYVTLTNMKEEEIDRIIKYRMSPINVSVHTTNPDLRVKMLKNRFAGNILERIKKLTDAGITVNCQIVLCRDVNDGEELDRTLSDLSCFFPGVYSISVVPVGITRHRESLYDLRPYGKQASLEVIERIEKWQRDLLDKYNSRVVYIADEFYIMAEQDLPSFDDYEDFPQIENGVGLISMLQYEVSEYLNSIKGNSVKNQKRKVSIATGTSPVKYIRKLCDNLSKLFNIEINVYPIRNVFFGENVTVTGLLTGQDIIEQLKDKDLGEELLISSSMLRSGEEVLLDDLTISDLERALNIKITAVENSGKDFVEKIAKINI